MNLKNSFFLVLLLFCARQINAQNTLEITISNIEIQEGSLLLQLFQDSTQFPGAVVSEAFIQEKKATNNEIVFVFNNLADGYYAIAVFQDLNEDKQLNTKKFGIPAEPFAFSNNALRKFRPPYFSQAQFLVKGGGVHQHAINMIYRKP